MTHLFIKYTLMLSFDVLKHLKSGTLVEASEQIGPPMRIKSVAEV